MKIAYILLDPGIGVFGTKGASVHVQEIIRSFRKAGHEVTVFCTRVDDLVPSDLQDLEVHRFPLPKGLDTAARESALLSLSETVAEEVTPDFDLVYERYSLFSTAGGLVARWLDIPLLLEVNAPLLDEQRKHRELIAEETARRATALSFEAASRLICVSDAVADWVRRDHPTVTEVLVVPNGVNTSRIRPRAAGREGTVESGGTADGKVRIGFVGTLKPWHGTDILLEAFARLPDDCHLEFCGDGPVRASLEQRADDWNISDRITFHGAVPPERVPDVLNRFDIAVAPYPQAAAGDHYFSPLKIYEYLAAGLPIVASRIGSIPGLLGDSGAGVVVPAGDVAALAETLAELAADPDRRAMMALAARTEALSEHDWSVRCEQILESFVPVSGESVAAVPVAGGIEANDMSRLEVKQR